MITALIRWYFKLIKKKPADMGMVSYWKKSESVAAKVTKAKDGSTHMLMEEEKYAFPTFPRGHILFGHLSKIKHEIKNQIFNESWRRLETDDPHVHIISDMKTTLFTTIADLAEEIKYDRLPPRAMTPSVRELHRAWTKVSPHTSLLRDYLCMILQEDDAYRFRVQWLVQWFGWLAKFSPVKSFAFALKMLEHGEVVSDMKERSRLLRRVLLLALEDPKIKAQFIAFFKEVNWKKVKLSKGDKYHFRGKYFKVDLKYLEY